jgi:hypothetical protein
VCDNSTWANYSSWASAISSAFSSFTWTQSSDTGQVVWTASVVSITAATHSGSNNTYTYTLTSGPALRVGMSIVVSGMTNSGNNGTFTITALGSGTFTVVDSSGVTETGSSGSGTVTANSTLPGSGAYFYEVWQPNDGLATFYAKVEYGNYSGQTNCPSVRLTLSTATNGAGTASNFIVGPQSCQTTNFTAPSTTAQYECDFSGAAGRFSCILWRNGTNYCQQAFAIERSVNSSGSYTASYVTLYAIGDNSTGSSGFQQTLHLTDGPGPISPSGSGSLGGLLTRNTWPSGGTSAFNGSIPFDAAAPNIGYFDYPGTVIGTGYGPDYVEGVPFTVSLYGATRTYMPSKNGKFGVATATGLSNTALCVRYD